MAKLFFSVKNTPGAIPEILVYGYIGLGEEGVNAGDFVKELKALEKDHPVINVRVNSGGGSIFDGITIYSAMKNSKAAIDTYVDGIAASMGSIVALGGRKVYMSKMAAMMTHRASGFAEGGADNMRQTAALMENLEETMCTIYAGKTGLSNTDARSKFLGKEDKWMTATEALEAKLIDGIFDADPIEIPITAKTDHEKWAVYSQKFNNQIIQQVNMKQHLLTAEQISLLTAKADPQPADITAAFNDLVQKAAKVDELTLKLTTATEEVKTLKSAAALKDVADLVDGAIQAKKIMAGDRAKYIKLATADLDTTKELIGDMKPYVSIQGEIQSRATLGDTKAKRLGELMGMSYDELFAKELVEELKAIDETSFQLKYKEGNGKEYKSNN